MPNQMDRRTIDSGFLWRPSRSLRLQNNSLAGPGSKPQLATAKELVRWVQLVSWPVRVTAREKLVSWAGDEAAAQLTDSTYWTMTLPIIHGCGVQLYVHVPAVSKVTEAVPPPPEMSPVSQLPSAAVAVWIVAPSLRQVRVVPTGTDTTCGVKLYSYVNVVPSNGRPPYTGVCGVATFWPSLTGTAARSI